jgi:non-ribosomal peptide synthetase component F
VPAGSPLFESLIVFENYPIDPAADPLANRLGDLRIEQGETDEQTDYKLTLSADCRRELSLSLQYRADTFSQNTAERVLTHLEKILVNMAQSGAEVSIGDLPDLTSSERGLLLAGASTATTRCEQGECAHVLFEARAQRIPNAVALVYEDASLSYEQLNAASNRLAHFLIENGVQRGMLVGLCVEASLDTVIGLLGIWKAGGVYVPLDCRYPLSRLHYITC